MTIGKKIVKREGSSVAIRTRKGLNSAIAEIDCLLSNCARSAAETSKLSHLSSAVRKYERRHFPVSPMSPAEQLKYLLNIHTATTRQLAEDTGVREDVLDAFLAGKGQFNDRDAKRLAKHFALDVSAFLAVPRKVKITFSVSYGEARLIIGHLKKVVSESKSKSRAVMIPVQGMVRVEPSRLRLAGASVW